MFDKSLFKTILKKYIDDLNNDKQIIPKLKKEVRSIIIPEKSETLQLPKFKTTTSEHGNWELESHKAEYMGFGRSLQEYTDLLSRFFKQNRLYYTELNKVSSWLFLINDLENIFQKKK